MTALIIQTFLGLRLLKNTDERAGFLFLPFFRIICFVFMILSAGLAPIVVTMFMQTLIGMSIQSNSVPVSFNVFASAIRGKIRTLLEGIITHVEDIIPPVGDILASLAIMSVSYTSLPVERLLPYFGILFAINWFLFACRIRTSYLTEIERTRQTGNARDKKGRRSIANRTLHLFPSR